MSAACCIAAFCCGVLLASASIFVWISLSTNNSVNIEFESNVEFQTILDNLKLFPGIQKKEFGVSGACVFASICLLMAHLFGRRRR
jgi:hypothetical protein